MDHPNPDTHNASISLNHSLFLRSKVSSSLLGLLLVAGLLALLLSLFGGLLPVDVFESLELFDEESSHDLILDLSSSEDSTVGSADGSLG